MSRFSQEIKNDVQKHLYLLAIRTIRFIFPTDEARKESSYCRIER